jgi:hypothetical protein
MWPAEAVAAHVLDMEILIGEPVPNLHTPDTFEVVVTSMIGDADGFPSFTVGPFVRGIDDEVLDSFLQLMTAMSLAYPNGRGGNDDYEHVDGFNDWFGYENMPSSIAVFCERLGIEMYWPNDPHFDGVLSFRNAQVFYYDAERVAHSTDFSVGRPA